MNMLERISQVFKSSKEIPIDDTSKIVLISDCHRSNGSASDDFSKNKNIYFEAIKYYYDEGYTYIELGDGDELWENSSFHDIEVNYIKIFMLLSKFYKENRLYFLFGNHDMIKKDEEFVTRNLYRYFDERGEMEIPLFEDIKLHEGLVLKYKGEENKILLLHGHQGDYFNDQLWRVAKFLVKYIWKPLEFLGVSDPISPAKNNEKRNIVDNKLIEWIEKEKSIIIAGHTHRPTFPDVGQAPYFNDGSCVEPTSITAIEIFAGFITLVNWTVRNYDNSTTFIKKEILGGPNRLEDYFKNFH